MACLWFGGWVAAGAEPVAVAAAPATLGQPAGFIQIKCEPGVRILIDGRESGVTSREQGGLVIQDVPPGSYVIQARKEGFQRQELRATVKAGAVHVLYVAPFLERAAPAGAGAAIGQRTGALVIRTVPVDCRLRVPGLMVDSEKSAAEWRSEAVPAGTYEIEVVALGRTLKQAVTVEPDATLDVLFNLLRGEVHTVTTQPPPSGAAAVAAAALPAEAQVRVTEARLATAERELADVRNALQMAREGADLAKIRSMMERRDELARLQRDLDYELSVLRQRARNEAESALRQAAQRRHRDFDADYAEYGRLARDQDVAAEVKLKAWAAVCAKWSVDPGSSSGRLLWDEAKAAPYRVLSRIVPLEGGVELELVEIVAGTFSMGSEDGDDDEKPVHVVAISRPFWIGKYEITQAQYRAVTGAAPSHFRGENRPVENVTWQDADGFCTQLSERERKAGRLPQGLVFRLPTEAEWEYACRAGSTTPFSFGERLDATMANYDTSQGAGRNGPTPVRETLPVGSFRANAWDLYDMHGNVWEWCADWYDREFYARSPQTNPFNVRPGPSVVCRGGSWVNPVSFCRSSNRNNGDGRQANHMTGFRVVLAPPPAP